MSAYWLPSTLLHADSAASFAGPPGIGEELTISTHTFFAASRAAVTLPFAASLQMSSSFALTLAETAAWVTPARQAATAACVIALLAPETDVGVEIVGVGELLAVLVVLELLLLPHPATSTPERSTAASHGDRLVSIGPPS